MRDTLCLQSAKSQQTTLGIKTNCAIWLVTIAHLVQTQLTVALEYLAQVWKSYFWKLLQIHYFTRTIFLYSLGSHSIAYTLLVFAPLWWRDHFKQVVIPMHLADIRLPEHLNPPPHFGPGSKRGMGDQSSDQEDSLNSTSGSSNLDGSFQPRPNKKRPRSSVNATPMFDYPEN